MIWINILLAILGLYITFTRKFVLRKSKNQFSFIFWLKDNWVELSQSLALLISLMVLLVLEDTVINLNKINIPLGEASVSPKPLLSFLLGFSVTEIMYWLNNRKKHWIKKKEDIV